MVRKTGALCILATVAAAQSSNPSCIQTKCGVELAACQADYACNKALACMAKCGDPTKNLACASQCSNEFETPVYDDFLKCTSSKCAAGFDPWTKCRSDVKPIPSYHGNPHPSFNLMRGLLERAWSLPAGGGWIVAKGLSDAYPCYDCQTSHWVDEDPTSFPNFAQVTDVKVHNKTDGSARHMRGNYQAHELGIFSDPGGTTQYYLSGSNDGGLHREERWSIIGADERDVDQAWVMMYYCGGVAADNTTYEGAVLMTPDGMMPKVDVAKIDSIFKANGLVPTCYPNNTYQWPQTSCADFPHPPAPPFHGTCPASEFGCLSDARKNDCTWCLCDEGPNLCLPNDEAKLPNAPCGLATPCTNQFSLLV